MARAPKPRTATPAGLAGPRLVRRSTRPAAAEPTAVSHDQIALHAYWLFLERGCVHGHDLDDWLTAERELLEARSESMAKRVAG
jgi:hypothetical protein